MSFILTAASWDLDISDPLEKMVLLALANHAGDDGHCWPSVARIREKTKLCERTIRNKLKKLKEHGYLKVGYNSGHSSDYILQIPGAPKPKESMERSPKTTKQTPAPNAPHPGTACTPPLHHMQEGGAPHAPIISKMNTVTESVRGIGGGSPSQSERISIEKAIAGIDEAIKEILNQASHDAWGPMLSDKERSKLKSLRASKVKFQNQLGIPT